MKKVLGLVLILFFSTIYYLNCSQQTANLNAINDLGQLVMNVNQSLTRHLPSLTYTVNWECDLYSQEKEKKTEAIFTVKLKSNANKKIIIPSIDNQIIPVNKNEYELTWLNIESNDVASQKIGTGEILDLYKIDRATSHVQIISWASIYNDHNEIAKKIEETAIAKVNSAKASAQSEKTLFDQINQRYSARSKDRLAIGQSKVNPEFNVEKDVDKLWNLPKGSDVLVNSEIIHSEYEEISSDGNISEKDNGMQEPLLGQQEIEELVVSQNEVEDSNVSSHRLAKLETSGEVGRPVGSLSRTVEGVIKREALQGHDKVERSSPESRPKKSDVQEEERHSLVDPEQDEKNIIQTSKIIFSIENVLAKSEERTTQANLTFVPDYDSNIFQYDSDGFVSFDHKLNSKFASITGLLEADGHIATHIDVGVLGDSEFVVPMFTETQYSEILQQYSKGKEVNPGILLIQVGPEIDADIYTEYSEKLYIDDEGKIFKEDQDGIGIKYVMFTDVAPGNQLIHYKFTDGHSGYREINIYPKILTFDRYFHQEKRVSEVAFFEERIQSAKRNELLVDTEKFHVFYMPKEKARILGPNILEMKIPYYPIGSREYFEIHHGGQDMLIGRWGDVSDLIVPSEESINRTFEQLAYKKDGRCFIQINSSKFIKSLSAHGSWGDVPIYLNKYFMNDDGEYDEQVLENSIKSFIIGDGYGAVSVKLEYIDESYDLFQTVCAPNRFIVEQI